MPIPLAAQPQRPATVSTMLALAEAPVTTTTTVAVDGPPRATHQVATSALAAATIQTTVVRRGGVRHGRVLQVGVVITLTPTHQVGVATVVAVAPTHQWVILPAVAHREALAVREAPDNLV